ncbi:ZMAT2 [Bugula neritina]|uniref:ZMAT2 n=1 Tax=Bugula neritina TaxID=10212 RepID=A0A7J7JEA0_BUGNE|nr:ZMAT2 [Bugula neritina]
MASNYQAKNHDDFRQKWDREKYEKLAEERLKELENEGKGKSSDEPPVKRALLKARDYTVDLEGKLGKSQVITKTTPSAGQGGYYCNVCDCVVKDSINYLDHINGKKHQRNLGMSMKVERSSLEQVKARFELNKRKQEEKKSEYDFNERMKELQEEEEKQKAYRKERRKEKKRQHSALTDDDGGGGMDPQMAAMMGFSGFGGSSKNN